MPGQLTKTLYKSLLRSALQLMRDAKHAPSPENVVRGGARTTAPIAHARLLERYSYWRSNLLPSPFCTHSQKFRRAITLQSTTSTTSQIKMQQQLLQDLSSPAIPELPIPDQIQHLVRAAFRTEHQDPTPPCGQEEMQRRQTLGFTALRELELLQVQFRLALQWHRFNALISGTAGTGTAGTGTAGTASLTHNKKQHTSINPGAADPLELGMALLVAQRDSVDPSLGCIEHVRAAIENMADMAKLVLQSQSSKAKKLGMCQEEQIIRALNHVLFVQHNFHVTLVAADNNSSNNSSGKHLRHEHQTPVDVRLCFLDNVLQESIGSPLSVAILWKCIGYRLGLQENIDIVGFPNTHRILLVVNGTLDGNGGGNGGILDGNGGTLKEPNDASCWVVNIEHQGTFTRVSNQQFQQDVTNTMYKDDATKPTPATLGLTRLATIVQVCNMLVHSYAATDGNTTDNLQEHRFADLICDLLHEDEEKDQKTHQPIQKYNAQTSSTSLGKQSSFLMNTVKTGLRRYHASAHASNAAHASTALFSVPVQQSNMLAMNDALNDELTQTAVRLYDKCWTSVPINVLQETHLSGGWRTAANVMFFRQQVDYTKQSNYTSHLPSFERSQAFQTMVKGMREASIDYLEGMYRRPASDSSMSAIESSTTSATTGTTGTTATTPERMTREQATDFCQHAPLYCWASVHTEGSGHPPHVHSDSAVTGTYYVSVPDGTAPLYFEDPRGKSPFDVLSGKRMMGFFGVWFQTLVIFLLGRWKLEE